MNRSRRRFMKLGAAGTGLLGWPVLTSLSARAQDAFPTRLLLVYHPNGTIQDQFWPSVSATGEMTLGSITQPLEPFKDRLLFLKGLTISVNEVGPGGPHQKGMGGLYTNNQLQEGDFVDGDGSRAGYADGISVDQEIARHIGDQTFLPSLELGVRAIDADVRARISYAGPGNPMPPVNAPLAAFDRLFAGFSDVDESVRESRQSVIDTVQQQYAALEPRLSSVDREKLEQHLDLVRGIERRLNIAVDTGLCERPGAPPELDPDNEETMPQVSALHGQLLAAAFACDLTRVASIQYSSAINDIRFPWLDSMGSGHTLSHAGPSNEEAIAERVARGNWMVQELANLMQQLDAIPEGNGTVLDNTLILLGNEIGVGNTHVHTNIPFVAMGGVSGKWRMGRFIDYGDVSHAGLMVSVLNAMGVEATRFGHPDFADGPLTDLV